MSPSVTFQFCPKQFWLDLKRAAVAVLVFASVVGVAHCGNSGCLPAHSPGNQDKSYEAEIKACSLRAATKAEARLCRIDVNTRYGLCDAPWPYMTPCDE